MLRHCVGSQLLWAILWQLVRSAQVSQYVPSSATAAMPTGQNGTDQSHPNTLGPSPPPIHINNVYYEDESQKGPASVTPEPIWHTGSCPRPCVCTMTNFIHLGERLKTVNCSNKNLSIVPRGIPFDTETLLLSNNDISDLHEQLPPLEQLLHLDISNNKLKQLGRGHIFMNFTRLRHLDLSGNEFKTLFAGVFRGLKRLEILLMKQGALRYVDEHAFDGLENLRTLDLEANHITSVYLELFSSILNLHVLNLGKNSISHLTGGIFASLNGLRRLILSENRITGINDNAFVGLDMLEEMRLRNNYLSRVPSIALQSLKRLRILDMGGNALQQIATGDLVHTPAVEVHIDNCDELTLIDRGAFWDLPNLKAIYAQDNARLEYIDPQAFLGVPSLALLQVSNSSLLTLQEELVINLVTHHEGHGRLTVAIYDNPVLCDCNVRFLHQCLKDGPACKVNLAQPNDIKCARPDNFTGRKVSDLRIQSPPDPSRPTPATVGDTKDGSQMDEVGQKCAPTLLMTGPRNGTVHKKIGERHVFQCRALGFPTPRLAWALPNGDLINETSNLIHMQLKQPGSLRMYHLKPRDSGPYTCVAENSVGKATAVQRLSVDNIDLHIWPLGVSATFVTVVWNGTARNSFPEYQILYRADVDPVDGQASSSELPRYESVTVSHFLRSYTINHLEPHTRYKLCIAVKDDDQNQLTGTGSGFLQLSCTSVTTQGHEYMLHGIQHSSNVATALAGLATIVMAVVICGAYVAARRYRQRTQYDTPEKSLLEASGCTGTCGHGAAGHSIPLEDIYSPLMTGPP